jgi:hypothetical protein
VELSRATLYGWMASCAELLTPVFDEIVKRVLLSGVATRRLVRLAPVRTAQDGCVNRRIGTPSRWRPIRLRMAMSHRFAAPGRVS